jgi:two-component system sensor histidine kinase KdpD
MISAVVDRCAAALDHHRVRLELDDDLPLVKVDARLLVSALANLVENAAQYSPAQSNIVVRGELDANANTLTTSVQDEGPGIPAGDLPRLFDKFYRGSNRLASRHEGTGMGLAIARGIVEAHGGTLAAENRDGGGARFLISLPVRVTDENALDSNS